MKTARAPLAFLLGMWSAPGVLGAQATTIVQGRITDSLRHPIARVELQIVTASMSRAARTREDGAFRVVFPEAVAGVSIFARRIGYEPTVWTVSDTMRVGRITVDRVLRPSAVELPPLFARPWRPGPIADPPRRALGNQNISVGSASGRGASDRGDLNEVLQTIAAALPDSGVLLDAGQRRTTILVDGLRVDASLLPPDVVGYMTYTASTADIAHGSEGGELQINTLRGGDSWRSSFRGATAHPSIAWSDPRSLALPYLGLSASGSLSGPIVPTQSHVFFAWSIDARARQSPILPAPGIERLERLGLDSDAMIDVVGALDQAGAPFSGSSRQVRRQGSLWVKTDWMPTSTTYLEVTAWPTWSRLEGPPGSATAFPIPVQGPRVAR